MIFNEVFDKSDTLVITTVIGNNYFPQVGLFLEKNGNFFKNISFEVGDFVITGNNDGKKNFKTVHRVWECFNFITFIPTGPSHSPTISAWPKPAISQSGLP